MCFDMQRLTQATSSCTGEATGIPMLEVQIFSVHFCMSALFATNFSSFGMYNEICVQEEEDGATQASHLATSE